MHSEIVARLEASLRWLPPTDEIDPTLRQPEVVFTHDLSYDEDRLLRLYRFCDDRRRKAVIVLLSDL